jgi:hypothetical protein
MTTGGMIEVAAGVVVLGLGIWMYRARKSADQGYGSQGAVILFVVAAILLIHGLGLLEYRPSQSELDIARERSR